MTATHDTTDTPAINNVADSHPHTAVYPSNAAPRKGKETHKDPNNDEDQYYSDCSFNSEEWEALDALHETLELESSNQHTEDKDDCNGSDDGDDIDNTFAHDLRLAMEESRQTHAQELARERELGEAGPSSFRVPDRSGAAPPTRVSATPTRSRVSRCNNGVWLFFPSQTQRRSSMPRLSRDDDDDSDDSPNVKGTSPKGKGKGTRH